MSFLQNNISYLKSPQTVLQRYRRERKKDIFYLNLGQSPKLFETDILELDR